LRINLFVSTCRPKNPTNILSLRDLKTNAGNPKTILHSCPATFKVRFAFAITISGASSPKGLISKRTIGGFSSFKNPICSSALR
jgi:hypothetical protein